MQYKLHNMSMYIHDVVIHDVWDIFMKADGVHRNPTYTARNSIPRESSGRSPQLAKMRAFGRFPVIFWNKVEPPQCSRLVVQPR